MKDQRGKPLKDAEGNRLYPRFQLDEPRVFAAVVPNLTPSRWTDYRRSRTGNPAFRPEERMS